MKIFRSVLAELNSDSEDENLNDEAPELDDLECEHTNFDNPRSLENFLSKLKFRDVHNEHSECERCKNLGGGKPLPETENPIPPDAYQNEVSLFLAINGTKPFEIICDSTNKKALKLKSEDTLLKRY